MAGTADFSFPNRFQHRTSLFAGMGAGRKTAFTEIWFKLAETIGKLFLAHHIVALHLNGRKTGGIGHITAALQFKQFHLTGCVAATSKLFADLPRLQTEAAVNLVEKR